MLNIDNPQKALGIIGYPIQHSLSPLMHNTALKFLSLDYSYYPFEVRPEDLSGAIEDIRSLKIKGINVTIPHKENIIGLLDDMNEDAKLIGAVNTVNREGEKLIGYNTDGKGFIKSLKEDAGESLRGKNILIFGAGGAARGLAVQIALEKPATILIANRTLSRAESLVKYLKEKIGFDASVLPLKNETIRDYIKNSHIIINATSIGMKEKDPPLFSCELLSSRNLVCDIVYNPLKTPLLKKAEQMGARVLDGLGMLIYQGALSFKIWTGKEFPVDLVRKILTEKLTENSPE